jgi:16S rRNA (guanine966-N2)-methyltransferase
MRVVAGRFRGRPLTAPRGLSTRPTIDRAREALFQILGPLDGLRAIDFYAGTGALGIEALSRGAAHAVFVEVDRAAVAAIQKNLQRLGAEEDATVLVRAVERCRPALERLGPFDLVLSDPPWKDAGPAAVLVARAVQGLLTEDARVVLGHPAPSPVEIPEGLGLERCDQRKYGGSGLSFFRRSG